MSDGFLSRWSRRKLEAKTSEAEVKARPIQESHDDIGLHGFVPQAAGADVQSTQVPQAQPQAVPVPTEEDLEAVKAGGDIRAFLSGQVSRDLKNKAFKTLFSRPEFNVMDGLDIYIDDYNKFTPLSSSDIDKMALSKQLLSRPDLDALKDKIEQSPTLLPEPPEAGLPSAEATPLTGDETAAINEAGSAQLEAPLNSAADIALQNNQPASPVHPIDSKPPLSQ